MLKRKRFLIGGLAVLLSIGYLMYMGFGSGSYYLTVSELQGMGQTIQGKDVRVAGKVIAGTVQQDPQTLLLTFTLGDPSDQGLSIPVTYKGIIPDSFQPGQDVVVEGSYDQQQGTFTAKNLIVKCASKYVPQL